MAALVVVLALASTSTPAAALAADAETVPPDAVQTSPNEVAPSSELYPEVPAADRDRLLGSEWDTVDDKAWTTVGDAGGFHVYVAESGDGFAWRRVATLRQDGVETDRWIGNACLIDGGAALGVVYAPRAVTNDETLFGAGGVAAIVDLETGDANVLGNGFSLAYFNPGCGSGTSVSFTGLGETATRIVTVDASRPDSRKTTEVEGQVTSAVPTSSGVVAAGANQIVRYDDDGNPTVIAETAGFAYDLTVTGDSGLAYVTAAGDQATVYSIATNGTGKKPKKLAAGDVTEVGLSRDGTGSVHITGDPSTVRDDLPEGIEESPELEVGADLSTAGGLAVESAFIADAVARAESDPDASIPAEIETIVRETGERVRFTVDPALDVASVVTSDSTGMPSSRSDGPAARLNATASADPRSPDSPCAIGRNDPAIQAYQPSPSEVEWAADHAVRGQLGSAQAMFPAPALSGGGTVPPQILLGIMAQESNLWQASRYTVPGVTGNPLIGDYFGALNRDGFWDISYADADCGYGIAQVTDGMRKGQMPTNQQLAIATDYRANMSRGLQILIEKWNQTRSAGLIVNDGQPRYLENWFFALWAYNSGFNQQSVAGVPWGVGWLNNPINPIYEPQRGSFLDNSPADAANPQNWPYPEKVLGFAANPPYFLESVSQSALGDTFNYDAAYAAAWWPDAEAGGAANRTNVKPPRTLFCDASNQCDPNGSWTPSPPLTSPAGPCYHTTNGAYDLKCWFHEPVEWKQDCPSICGQGLLGYQIGSSKPAGPNSYPPACNRGGLPESALIIDNVPSGTSSPRCDTTVDSAGSFSFDFAPGPAGNYPSKVDLHQLGSGHNGQFYFTHTRIPGTSSSFGGALDVSGTWTLGTSLDRWARVYAHMPNHGAWTQQANYMIDRGDGAPVRRSVNQRNYANEWVSLGVHRINGVPSVSLANDSATYQGSQVDDGLPPLGEQLSGVDDIAWDAVAFVPLSAKPTEMVVSLGDSYSSGEGTSALDGSDFFRGSDHHGGQVIQSDGSYAWSPHRNACHRSTNAWAYGLDLPAVNGTDTIRQLVANPASPDPRIDYQMLACSGAETIHVVQSGTAGRAQQYGELSQLDRGFVDENTTLVTLTIGGNDTGFGPVIEQCVVSQAPGLCEDHNAPADMFSGTLGQMVESNLAELGPNVVRILNQVKAKGPNARILLMGYPTLFESTGSCLGIPDIDKPWLNGVADRLNSVLAGAAESARTTGVNVVYQTPQYKFQWKNLCTPEAGLNGLIPTLTPGDRPSFYVLGTQWGVGMSAQSVHPNVLGSALYSSAANETLRNTRVSLSGSLVGGAPTQYYATARLHDGGSASMNVSKFAACGQEVRFGLRRGTTQTSVPTGVQHTDTLSWTSPNGMKTFKTAGSNPTADLPAGWYAVNARLVSPCPGGAAQPWEAQLHW